MILLFSILVGAFFLLIFLVTNQVSRNYSLGISTSRHEFESSLLETCEAIYSPLGFTPKKEEYVSLQVDPAFRLGYVADLPSSIFWLEHCRNQIENDHPICREYEEDNHFNVEYLFPASVSAHPQVHMFNASSDRYANDLLFIPFMRSIAKLDPNRDRSAKLSVDDNNFLSELGLTIIDEDIVQIDLWNEDQEHPIKMFFHGNVGSNRGFRIDFHENKNAFAVHSRHVHIPYGHRLPFFTYRSQSELELLNPHRKRPLIAFFMGSRGKASFSSTRSEIVEAMSGLQNSSFVDLAGNTAPLKLHMKDVYEATFCPCPLGDSDDTKRIFSAILGGCIPIIASDWIVLPFEGILDWSKFSIIVPQATIRNTILSLNSIDSSQIIKLRQGILCVRDHFLFNEEGSKPGDATDMILTALSIRGKMMREFHRWLKLRHR
jgi:Exostosin family